MSLKQKEAISFYFTFLILSEKKENLGSWTGMDGMERPLGGDGRLLLYLPHTAFMKSHTSEHFIAYPLTR